jgi:hypothetical protein
MRPPDADFAETGLYVIVIIQEIAAIRARKGTHPRHAVAKQAKIRPTHGPSSVPGLGLADSALGRTTPAIGPISWARTRMTLGEGLSLLFLVYEMTSVLVCRYRGYWCRVG